MSRKLLNLVVVMSFIALAIYIFKSEGMALSSTTSNDKNKVQATILKDFVEKEVEKKDIKAIEKEAKSIAKKMGLYIAFVDGDFYNTTKVNIFKDLDNRHLLILSFEVDKSKVD